MKDGSLWFPVVPHKDGALVRHLEVGPFPSNFDLQSVSGLLLRANEELLRPRVVVDNSEVLIFILSVFYSRSRTVVPIIWGLVRPPMPLNSI